MRVLQIVLILFLQYGFCFVQAIPQDPVWLEDFDSFADKPVVVLWRGTHLLKEYFPNPAARERYWDTQEIGEPMYAAAAYRQTRIPLGAQPNERQKVLLYNAARSIQGQIDGLSRRGSISLNGTKFENHRYAFQHVYSNDYNLFGQLVRGNAPAKYAPLVAGLKLEGNPFVSCSQDLAPSVKYGIGLKYYGNNVTILDPSYDDVGRPRNPFLGVLHGIVLNELMVKETLPFSVPAHHALGHIRVSTHYTCNILTEAEVSLLGRVPPKAVVLKYPITVPSFAGDYDGDYRERYGLTQRRFNNIKAVLTDTQIKAAEKEEKVKTMMEQIISSPRKDKAGYHKCTLSYRLRCEMMGRLEGVGAEPHFIGSNGTLEDE